MIVILTIVDSINMERLKLAFKALFLLFMLNTMAVASPYYGAQFSYATVENEPPYLHGYQFMLSYDPQRFQWRQFNIYFDGGFSHFWITSTPYYTNLNIYSIAPVVHYTFKRRGPFLPYLEFSVGVAYLNHTHLDDRNLGIHFAFQDRLGIGAFLGPSEQFFIGVHTVHYSNAGFAENNSGISALLDIDIGYRFS